MGFWCGRREQTICVSSYMVGPHGVPWPACRCALPGSHCWEPVVVAASTGGGRGATQGLYHPSANTSPPGKAPAHFHAKKWGLHKNQTRTPWKLHLSHKDSLGQWPRKIHKPNANWVFSKTRKKCKGMFLAQRLCQLPTPAHEKHLQACLPLQSHVKLTPSKMTRHASSLQAQRRPMQTSFICHTHTGYLWRESQKIYISRWWFNKALNRYPKINLIW